jgi:predicted nucleotidyltransferase
MANVKLRDRDGIVTAEGVIFRVMGYSHPRNAYICDTEYASADIFQSKDPRALRNGAREAAAKSSTNSTTTKAGNSSSKTTPNTS